MSAEIIIGVTGHRNLRSGDVPELKRLVREELTKLKDLCPDSGLVMMNSLAAGADCLCAEEALSLGIRLVCPLPVEEPIFRRDFSPEELVVHDRLLAAADDAFAAPWLEEGNGGRHFRFRQAGLYIASRCIVLMALWNGDPAKPDGCGTAEVVDFMLNSGSGGRGGPVIQIVTPRASRDENPQTGSRLIEPYPGCLAERITEII